PSATGPASHHVPKAHAKLTISSGVSASPTTPRTPEVPIFSCRILPDSSQDASSPKRERFLGPSARVAGAAPPTPPDSIRYLVGSPSLPRVRGESGRGSGGRSSSGQASDAAPGGIRALAELLEQRELNHGARFVEVGRIRKPELKVAVTTQIVRQKAYPQ